MATMLKLVGPHGKPYLAPAPARRQTRSVPVRAKYDAAQTTDEHARLWVNTDSLSAAAANSPDVRQKLRDRARYEAANNGYAAGLLSDLGNYVVGTGPTLDVLTLDEDANAQVEKAWKSWSKAIDLAAKLRMMRESRARDGEVFGLFITNEALATPVKLDLRVIECDQVSTPTFAPIIDPLAVDGIEFDDAGNPTFYHVLREHPGDLASFGTAFGEYDRVPARLVVHWFRCNRAGQARGVPEITPSIPLFALLRRFTLATVIAAETAADFAAMLQSSAPPDGEMLEGDPFETLEIERGMMTTLPAGWSMNQLESHHPATTYPQFKKEILSEAGRPLSMSYGTISGSHENYNFSSARLDHLLEDRSIEVDRDTAELRILDRLFSAWLEEAKLVDILPVVIQPPGASPWPHQWLWPGTALIDPQNESAALQTMLQNNATTLTDYYASQGLEIEVQLKKRAKELQMMGELGIPTTASPSAPSAAPAAPPSRNGSRNGQPSPNGAGNGQAN